MTVAATATIPAVGPTRERTVDRRPLIGYLNVTGVLAVTYFLFPEHHLLLWTPLGVLSVGAMVVGIRLHRPSRPAAWWFLAAATFCFILGDTTYSVLTDVLGYDNPFPSLADAFYLLTYPLFAAGLLLLMRNRGALRDHSSLLDASVVLGGAPPVDGARRAAASHHQPGRTPAHRGARRARPHRSGRADERRHHERGP